MIRSKNPSLDDPVSGLRGVGVHIAEKLSRLGITTIRDLLFHLPVRYLDRTRLTPIGALMPGINTLVEGKVEITQVKFGKRRSLLCRISDGTGALTLRFFYFSKSQQNRLVTGTLLRCYGSCRHGAQTLEMIHPEYQVLQPDRNVPVEETLTPVYPATGGLQQRTLRKLVSQALDILDKPGSELAELFPEQFLSRFNLPDLRDAIRFVHNPPPDVITDELVQGIHPAQQRLAFEELLARYLCLQQLRKKTREHRAVSLASDGELENSFLQRLPFSLTAAQKHAAAIIREDLEKDSPMLRLLQGDVGSGKTVVAVLAGLQAIAAGYQVAFMAPTELLAEQHFDNLQNWLQGLPVSVICLTGKLSRSQRAEHLQKISEDTACIVAGTHALFQQGVEFHRLRLVIIDEQHRFGVHQRLALLEKCRDRDISPHQLIMTATPIPRTLAMTLYADLDLTVIDEMPPGRLPVNTVVIATDKRDDVIERIRNACAGNRQVYWVCTLIEESESLQAEAAIATFDYLAEKLREFTIGLIHGRLKSREKETIMRSFKEGRIQLLVATTVIEVGVDVPNASLMVIENAERLGLFQLHQLRGRIGRGSRKSDCVLLYQPPLGELARTRLDTMRSTNNGFEIAQKDLEIRGPGEFMGTRQTGITELRIADLMRDAGLLPDVHKAARIMTEQYPDRIPQLVDRWLGPGTDFTKV